MKTSFKAALLTGAATAIALGVTGAAHAQTEDVDVAGAGDTVTVTGSRIQATGMTTPTPVTAVTGEQLDLAAPGNIVEGLVKLPQFYNSSTPSDPTGGFFATPGYGNLDLRGLATDRTLVLLDGRRLPSSTRYGGTDINTFPEGMIERVEAVTGGASAAYGTDAVAGVVNFILNTDFVGAKAHGQYGITERGDNEAWEAGASYGTELFNGRGHLLLSGERYEQEGLYTYEDREWYEEYGLVLDNNSGPRLIRPNVRSTTLTLDGVISQPGSALDRLEFLPGGGYRPFVLGPVGSTTGSYQSHVASGGASGTDNNVKPTLTPETSRESYFAYADFDVTDNVTIFAQGLWGQNKTRTSNLNGLFYFPFMPLTIYQENPYLPDELRQIMIDEGLDSFRLQRVGSLQDTARDRWDLTDNTMRALTVGFDAEFLRDGVGNGDWLKGWNAHGYYQDGETDYEQIIQGGIRIDRLPLATDAVLDGSGNIVCRVNTEPFLSANGGRWSNCEPVNWFGRGNMSEAGLDYITGFDPGQQIDTVLEYTDTGTDLGLTDSYVSGEDKVSSGVINQEVFEVSFDGQLWKGWGAGPISAAFGFHYREESINQIVRIPVNPSNSADARPVPANDPDLGVRGSPGFNSGNSVAIQFSKIPNIRGSLDTNEFFGELLVPVIADQPWMRQLNINGQARRADFSGSGEIWAWKVGGDAQVTDELRFRATRSRDIRAANLAERFDRTGGFAQIVDWPVPCLDDNGQEIACPIFVVSGGDPAVNPEVADTITIGGVYQPDWFPGFSISVDWYDIDLSDAIATLTAQQIADQCQQGDQVLCSRIETDENGGLVLINQSVLNVAAARVSGWDVEASYQRRVNLLGGGETAGARLFVSYLTENSRTNFMQPTLDSAGNLGFPELKVTGNLTYRRGPLTVFLQGRYESEVIQNQAWEEGVDIEDNTIPAVFYADLNLSYEVEAGGADAQLFLNVANLLDKDPPIVPGFANFGGTSSQTGGSFDVLGRRYTAGLRVDF